MSERRTLKDMKFNVEFKPDMLGIETNVDKILREVAIEWIKYFSRMAEYHHKEYDEGGREINKIFAFQAEGSVSAFKHFFNITDEDLKEK